MADQNQQGPLALGGQPAPTVPNQAQPSTPPTTPQVAPGRIFEQGALSGKLSGMDKLLMTMAQISALAGDASSVDAIRAYMSIPKGSNTIGTLHTLGSTLGTLINNGVIDPRIGRMVLSNALSDNGVGEEGMKAILPIFDKMTEKEKHRVPVHFRETTGGQRVITKDPETGKLLEEKVPGTIPSIAAERLTSGRSGKSRGPSSPSTIEPTIKQVQENINFWEKQEDSEQKRVALHGLKRKLVELIAKESGGGVKPPAAKARIAPTAGPLVKTPDTAANVPQGLSATRGTGFVATQPFKKTPRQRY